MDYILAHDVGTSGCKTVLFCVGGDSTCGKQVVAQAYETYPTYYPQPLYAEQDVEDWWSGVVKATRRVLEQSGAKPEQVLAISFSSQMVNVIPVDRTGTPLRPCISWLDGRAWEEAGQVMRKLGGPSIFNILVGAVISGKDLIPKYLWLKRHEPEVYRKAAALIDCGNFMLYRTTGRLVYERSVSSVTGLFNLKTKTWDSTIIRLFGLDADKFPELVRSIDKVGGLLPQAAKQMGLLEGTPVYGGAGDAMCTAVGSGAVGDGDAHIALGTSGYIGVTTSHKVTGRHGIVTLQAADPSKLLLIAEGETVGASLKWAVKELYGLEPGGESYALMDSHIDKQAPGSGSLIFTPWLYGERCPVPDESARAAFINLGANHTRDQMARAVYEGVAYNFRWILDLIQEQHGFACQPLRAVGGGARGVPWLRILADVTGRTMEKTTYDQEAAAVGAALIGAIGAGACPSFDAVKGFVPVLQSFPAEVALQDIYQPLYQAYRKVYPALRQIYHSLNRVE